MAVLKALSGAPDFKALPGSAKINGEPVKDNQPIKGKLISIKKSVININKFLDKKKERTEKQNEKFRKQDQNFKRKEKEEKLEEPKKEWKKLVPKKIPGLSFFDSIKKFVSGWILGFIAIKLIPLLPKLIPVVIGLGKIVNWFINLGGKFLNGIIGFVDFGIKAQEATLGFIKNLGGEKFANAFEGFMKAFGTALDLMLIVGALSLREALSGDSGLGDGLGDLLNPKKLKNFGKSVLTQGSKLAKGTWGAVKTVGAGLKAAAPALGWVASAGLLASAVGEGGAQLLKFGKHLEKNAVEASKKAKDKPWWNLTKYWDMAVAGVLGVTNRMSGAFFGLFDIIGAPFRLIIEGLRWPFMSQDQRDKAALNLEKFDARIREQFRGFFNMFDFLNVVPDEEGSWGAMNWSKKGSGTDEMGYTEDGKPKESKTLFSKESKEDTYEKIIADGGEIKDHGNVGGERIIEINYPDKKVGGFLGFGGKVQERRRIITSTDMTSPVEDIINKNKSKSDTGTGTNLASDIDEGIRNKIKSKKTFKVENGIVVGGTGTQEEYEKLKKIQRLEEEEENAMFDYGINSPEHNEVIKKRLILSGTPPEAIYTAKDGTVQIKGYSSVDGKTKISDRKKNVSGGLLGGIKRAVGGFADFATLGMFDFDNQNREGAPKDFGIRRIVGGLADYATLGLTDFDKRGKGNLQVNPIGGGKDKAWGTSNEQAKRREKQSGFGLKRGIGGLLDFATAGMFDFDKQNRRGAPKGFGIKRIAGGLADFVTAGATDFDKRGTGIGQMNLGEKMSKKKAYENNARVKNFMNRGDELYDKVNQLPMETTVNPDGSITSKGSGKLIGGELFRSGQPLTERQYSVVKMSMRMGNTYGDDVMKSYIMYEQQGGNIVKDNLKGSSNLKLGKQPVKFNEELLGVSASYETDGGQKEFIVYAPTTEINILPVDNSDQLVTSRATASSGDDPYGILEKGN